MKKITKTKTASPKKPSSMNKGLPAKCQVPLPSPEVESLIKEIAALRGQLNQHLAPVSSGSMDEVDALRRVLNDLVDARMNDVIRELVTIRNSASPSGIHRQDMVEQMDTLLAGLGALKFEAERLEHVDPLIHTIARETRIKNLPDGIITETLRPGFHTARGIIVAKALVTVNRGI